MAATFKTPDVVNLESDLISALNKDDFVECERLLQIGADSNKVLSVGVAPIHIASGLGLEHTRLLLEYDGDPNVRSEEGNTPLHVAATWGNRECLTLLLQNGGDPYLRDQDGMTVFSAAQAYGQDECVRILEEYSTLLNIDGQNVKSRFYITPNIDPLCFDQTLSKKTPLEMPPRKSCVYNNMNLEDFFQYEKSDNFYTEEINRKLHNCAVDNQKVCLDVTSPEHPYLTLKCDQNDSGNGDETTLLRDDLDMCQSLHVRWADQLDTGTSPTSNATKDTSTDSFITCNSETEDCSPSLLTGKCQQQTNENGCFQCRKERKKVRCNRDLNYNNSPFSQYKTIVSDIKSRSDIQKSQGNSKDNTAAEYTSDKMWTEKIWLPPTINMNDTGLNSSEGSGSFLNNGHLSDLMTSDESSADTVLYAYPTTNQSKEKISSSEKTNSVEKINSSEKVSSSEKINSSEVDTNLSQHNSKKTMCKSSIEGNMLLNLESLKKMSLQDKINNYFSPEKKPQTFEVAEDLESSLPTFTKRISNSADSSASTVEYVYTDPDQDIVLIERHLPSDVGSVGRRSVGSNVTCNTVDSQMTEIYDWRETLIPQKLQSLTNEEVRTRLKEMGEEPGPVTNFTRQTYLIRLNSLEKDPGLIKLSKNLPDYPPELRLALDGNFNFKGLNDLEQKMVVAFMNSSKTRRWREGTIKSSFNYILLDPCVTLNLPNRSQDIGELESFRAFIGAIFYIGKGKRARPYSHLYEALKQMKNPQDKVSEKVQHILDIWKEDKGVVSLHIFQNVIPVEAYTREAVMVDAIGLQRLTNKKRGDYYGVSTTWSLKQKRSVGVWLLQRAMKILLAEGERQITPPDIGK